MIIVSISFDNTSLKAILFVICDHCLRKVVNFKFDNLILKQNYVVIVCQNYSILCCCLTAAISVVEKLCLLYTQTTKVRISLYIIA